MNARLYDAALGRFLSPDPYVQAPDFSQSFNRYSYCWNNPLLYVDPDGEFVWMVPIIAGALMGGYSGYKIGKANGATGWSMFGYIAGEAAIGGLAGYTGFSVFSSAMAAGTSAGVFGISGGISAGINAGLLSGMASGAITGGGMAALSGGNVGDILSGATVGAFFGGIGGALAGGISGGLSNIDRQFNFWGTKLTSNSKFLLASNETFLGGANGWIPGATVRATNLMAAAAARSAMNDAGKVILQTAMNASMAMSVVGVSRLAVGAMMRMGARQVPKYLYHYTSREAARSISQSGLRVGKDGYSYLTNKSTLSPLQAQIELALPANRTLPSSLLRIRTSGLYPEVIRRVQGNLPGFGAGGGKEFLFNQHIPARLIEIIY